MSIKSKNWPVETIFLPKTRFLPKTIFIQDKKIALDKNPKMENLPETKKTRLISDFSLDPTSGWGGVSSTMIIIGNFRVIKGIT